MAERAHEVPAKYGPVTHIFHPRMRSYARRVEASLPGTITLIAAIMFLAYKRPALPYIILVSLIAFFAAIQLYSVLKPTMIALTKTHVLRARVFGWHAVERSSIDHTIFVEKLYAKKAYGQDLKGMVAKLRYRSFPSLWAIDSEAKPLLRLDGRVWDGKTMREVSAELSDQTSLYKAANVVDIDRQHPGLISFGERHPGWKSAVIISVSAAVVILLAVVSLLPEETAHAIHLY